MVKSWPPGINKGAEFQFKLLEYCQPLERQQGPRKDSQAAHKDEQSSSPPTPGDEEVETNSSGVEKEGVGKPKETITIAEKRARGQDHDKDKNESPESEPPSSLVDRPKQYYESPDLKVVIKGEGGDTTFLVASQSLAMGSKEWRKILNPISLEDLESRPFEASADGTIKVLYLDGVDPLSLDILFQVLHWETEDLPHSLTFDALRKLAVACDKFDCGRILNLWPLVWMEEYEELATLPGYEDWMFIARALHTKNSKVQEITRRMILEVSSASKCGNFLRRDVRGPVVAAHTTEIEINLIPPAILEYVLQERARAVDEVVRLLRQFVGDLTSANEGAGPGSFGLAETEFCRHEACSDIAFGSLCRSLKALNLWPLLHPGTPQEWHGSITTLVMQIENIRMSTFLQPAETAFGPASKPSSEPKPEAPNPNPEALNSNPEPPKPKSGSPKSKVSLKKRNKPLSTRLAPYLDPDLPKKTATDPVPQTGDGSSTVVAESQEKPEESSALNNLPLAPFSTSLDQSELAFSISEDIVWGSTIFGGITYDSVKGYGWAATMKELRYEFPVFEATYRPQAIAHAPQPLH
ncbi:hypothetical protein TWF481_010825 [Arthrobotrys musiformis]|uniref:BTB domain-containing protein n=1 Tax=Arthrobotrys musiformis TaxID=47236 RepID=A0AAV9W233_9PEZI